MNGYYEVRCPLDGRPYYTRDEGRGSATYRLQRCLYYHVRRAHPELGPKARSDIVHGACRDRVHRAGDLPHEAFG